MAPFPYRLPSGEALTKLGRWNYKRAWLANWSPTSLFQLAVGKFSRGALGWNKFVFISTVCVCLSASLSVWPGGKVSCRHVKRSRKANVPVFINYHLTHTYTRSHMHTLAWHIHTYPDLLLKALHTKRGELHSDSCSHLSPTASPPLVLQ